MTTSLRTNISELGRRSRINLRIMTHTRRRVPAFVVHARLHTQIVSSLPASVIYQDTEAPEVVVGNRFESPDALPADANIN